MIKKLRQLLIPIGYHFARLYWFITRPTTRGVRCVIEHQEKFLLIRQNYGSGRWTVPGGGIEAGEAAHDAAVREVKEETGIDITDLVLLGTHRQVVEYKNDTVDLYSAKATTNQISIDPAEIKEARWFARNELPQNISQQVTRIFGYYDRHISTFNKGNFMNEVDTNAKIIWDYMLLHQGLRPVDAIFVLGSNDTRVAERAADLYLSGYAPRIIFSGGAAGKGAALGKPEAEAFAEVAMDKGVPKEVILQEKQASNTGENILFTRRLLEENGIYPRSLILVQKPYMERRTYATVRKQWPDVDIMVTSPPVSYEEYPDPSHFADKERFISTMVGDLQRIKEYPAQGFQIPQEIPDTVWQAGENLIRLGYTRYALSIQVR